LFSLYISNVYCPITVVLEISAFQSTMTRQEVIPTNFLPHFFTDARKYFFSSRVINIWNSFSAKIDFTNILLSGPLQLLTFLFIAIVLVKFY